MSGFWFILGTFYGIVIPLLGLLMAIARITPDEFRSNLSKWLSLITPRVPHVTVAELRVASRGAWLVQAISTWLASMSFTIDLPSLPLAIEAAKHVGKVQPESYYLTAAVLAALFVNSSDHNLFRFGYISIFLGTIALEFQPESGTVWIDRGWAAIFMIAAAIIHAIERFRWHVVLNRGFPDWLKGP